MSPTVIPITLETTDFQIVRNGIIDEYLSPSQSYPWIVTFSGGKDSTLVAHLVFEALLELPPSLRNRKIYFVSNDTLVESPLVAQHMHRSLKKILDAAKILKLPVEGTITKPSLDKTFWTLLIGKGYPSPNRNMRWCTDRLKIEPTSQFIKNTVDENGAAIILLGVRKDESSTRKTSIESHKNIANSNLTPHGSLTNAFVYRPIVDVSTDDVWEFLSLNNPPWGGTHDGLIRLYREAAGGECPIVLSQEEAPGCGTNSSRFGCWTCTVVNKDKSLQGFVDIGKTEFQPLLDFRDWLIEIRNTLTIKGGKHIPGPFTVEARQMILNRLLEVQTIYGSELITQEEIDLIKQIWADDLIALHSRKKIV